MVRPCLLLTGPCCSLPLPCLQKDKWDGVRMDKDAALQVFGADEVHYSSEVGNKEARVGQGRTCRVGQDDLRE